jgi:hypothetical protein
MNTKITQKNSVLLTQEWHDDNPGEPAILVQPYSDTVVIEQEGRTINLNYHHIDELCRILKSMKKLQQ